jgi:hypothetical protein
MDAPIMEQTPVATRPAKPICLLKAILAMLRTNPKFKIHQNLGKSKVDFISWRLCPFVLKIPIQNWLGEWFPGSLFEEMNISFLS